MKLTNRFNLDIAICILIFVIAFIARFSLTAYGLPYLSIWDEGATVPLGLHILQHPYTNPNIQPYDGWGVYGNLLTYVTVIAQFIGFMIAKITNSVSSLTEFTNPPSGVNYLPWAVHVSGIPLWYPRIALAFINSWSPIFIYYILRKCFTAWTHAAFSAALILAFFSRDILYFSSYVLPDAFAITLFTILLLFSYIIIWRSSDHLLLYFYTGILSGFMLSIKLSYAFAIILPITATAVARYRYRLIRKLCFISCGFLAGFVLTSPHILLHPSVQWKAWTLFININSDFDLTHRLAQLSYYIKAAFGSTIVSSYVGSADGGIGLGAIVGWLALLGIGKLVLSYPQYILTLLPFSFLQLYLISAMSPQYSRYAHIFYPVVCIAAGLGINTLIIIIQNSIAWLEKKQSSKGFRYGSLNLKASIPTLVFILFILSSFDRLYSTVTYINEIVTYKPPQEQVIEYLANVIRPDDKVGIFDFVPITETDLDMHKIPFERITVTESLASLESKQITYVVGTDKLTDLKEWQKSDSDPNLTDTEWEDYLKIPGNKLAEFGNRSLPYRSYPLIDLYIFVARISKN